MKSIPGYQHSLPNFYVLPQALPSSPTAATSQDTWLRELEITFDGNGFVTVQVYDNQSPTPQPLIPPTQIAKGAMISVHYNDPRPMPGGISWSSSPAGASGWMIGYQ